MKILSCHLENFASYKTLDFNFQDQGLTLIHGATGSGKSTLMDAVPWILFGVTAKNGKADEVCSWQGGITKGALVLSIHDHYINITRIRGKNVNDLYYTIAGTMLDRGKDIPDTQKLINQLLGFDADLYLSGAYLHEFSQTSQFFTTSAKNRRTITEQLVDLSLAKKLTEDTSARLKTTRQDLMKAQNNYNSAKAFMLNTETMLKEHEQLEYNWRSNTDKEINRLALLSADWDNTTLKENLKLEAQIAALEVQPNSNYINQLREYDLLINQIPVEECDTCGCDTKNHKELEGLKAGKRQVEKQQAETASNKVLKLSLEKQLNAEATNPHKLALGLLIATSNPHKKSVELLKADYISDAEDVAQYKSEMAELTQEQTDLDILQDVISQFRSILIENTILAIQDETNKLLTDHFDGEIRIELTVSDADKAEVLIVKDGNTASFSQLSKGQRCLLKLAFGVSVMKAVQQHHSVGFEQLFFDEALDGLDDNFKVKAYGLLQALAVDYNSVYCVEHSSALKERFENKFLVTLNNGVSEIEQD